MIRAKKLEDEVSPLDTDISEIVTLITPQGMVKLQQKDMWGDWIDVPIVASSEPYEKTMTSEEWKKRCAAQYVEVANVEQEAANQMAEACFEDCYEEGFHPEDAADEDMSCWDYD